VAVLPLQLPKHPGKVQCYNYRVGGWVGPRVILGVVMEFSKSSSIIESFYHIIDGSCIYCVGLYTEIMHAIGISAVHSENMQYRVSTI
jgi:hypothetical protein